MPLHAKGTPAQKTQNNMTEPPGKQDLSRSPLQFKDNRPETALHRKLVVITNAGPSVSPASRRTGEGVNMEPVVQRVVLKTRRTGKWYTDKDPTQLFDTKEEAEEYQYQLIDRELEERDKATREKREERTKKRKRELTEKFGDYKPPAAKRARLFKNNDTKFDDVDLTTLGPDNAKKFMEFSFQQRRADEFRTQ